MAADTPNSGDQGNEPDAPHGEVPEAGPPEEDSEAPSEEEDLGTERLPVGNEGRQPAGAFGERRFNLLRPETRKMLERFGEQTELFRRNLARQALASGLDDKVARFADAIPIWQPATFRFGAAAFGALSGPNLFAGTLAAREAAVRVNALMPQQRWHAAVVGTDWALPLQKQLSMLASTSFALTATAERFRYIKLSPQLEAIVGTGLDSWARAVRAVDTSPHTERLVPLSALGRGTVGVVEAAYAIEDVDESEFGDQEGLLTPSTYAGKLREALGLLDRGLPSRLDGAWERLSHPGPHAASQAAHSMMEAIDWALRLAAPNDDVLAWHSTTQRPQDELHNGKPTRTLRTRYLLRDRPDEAKAAEMHIKSLAALATIIQNAKHGLEGASPAAVRMLIPTVEGFLIFVLLL